MKEQIVNIINFIRGVEPRYSVDLPLPVAEQIKLIDKYNFKATFLVQYDALIMPEFQALLKNLDTERYEIGLWYEIVQPLCEKCGIEWTGRYPWDWHCHCGFSVGYTKPQREKLADEAFAEFKKVFGYYPKAFGSWLYDSHTVRYICDKYEIDALCNCKEQFGTDGYTLWGGYYGQGYYPSRKNVFMPAQNAENQIKVPLFRMLGSDPVYQFDFGLDVQNGASESQGVITLEPVYKYAGANPRWVDWYLKENFNGECLSFGYAQAGQENSFGWTAMKDGLEYQFSRFYELQQQGSLIVEPLGATGRRYKSEYPVTPASAITAHSAYDDAGKKSVWFSSRFYRTNLYLDDSVLRIRDLHLFSENCADRYEDEVCTENCAVYETLPVADGNRFSGSSIISGVYFEAENGEKLRFNDMKFTDCSAYAELFFDGENPVRITLREKSMEISAEKALVLRHATAPGAPLPKAELVSEKELAVEYNGCRYSVTLSFGSFRDPFTLCTDNGKISALFNA